MRKELLGPLPLLLGVAIVAAALLAPARAPPPAPCACPILTAAGFQALDASGYSGVASGDTLVVDGRVASIYPSELVSAPFRLIRLEGSSLQFNVTAYNAATGPVGEWVRITAVHAGENESRGPDFGHRWSYGGKTAPAGGSPASLAGIALGLAVAGWGVATWKEFSRTARRAKTLKARVAAAQASRAGDPAASKAAALGKELEAAAAMVRRGQYDSAETALQGVEAQIERAENLGEALAAARAAVVGEAKAGFFAGAVEKILAKASEERESGSVPEAEKLLERALGMMANLPSLRELLDATEASLAASSAQGIVDVEAPELLEKARERLAAGEVDEALPLAERAFHRAREVSPAAQTAAREMERLRDFLQVHPELDRTREVRDRVRDADELYRLGMFARALAEARVGVWLADPQALSTAEFDAIIRSRYARLGHELDPNGAPPPPLGFLAVRQGERVVIVTSTWRDFPGERIIFALKDFIRDGGAARAVVYSSAFTNTSTDPRIEVVDASALVELLRDAALAIPA